MPVATPSRAVTQFWSKYKVLKPHTNPMLKKTPEGADASVGTSTSAREPVSTEPDLPRPEATRNASGDDGAGALEPMSTEPDLPRPEATVGATSDASGDAGAGAPEPMSTEPDLPRPEASAGDAAGDAGARVPEPSDSTVPTHKPDHEPKKVNAARPPVEARVPEYVQALSRIPDPNLLWTDPAAKDMRMKPLKLEKKPLVKEEVKSPTYDPVVARECDRFIAQGGLESIEERLNKMDDQETCRAIERFKSHPSLPSYVAYIRECEQKCGEPGQYEFGSTGDLTGELVGLEAWLHAENMVNKPVTPAKIPEKKASPLSTVKAVLTRATTVDLTPTPPTASVPPPTGSVPQTPVATVPDASPPTAVRPRVLSLDSRLMCSIRWLVDVSDQLPWQFL
eukprot:s1465_g2.t1